jgi:hypothetical protein
MTAPRQDPPTEPAATPLEDLAAPLPSPDADAATRGGVILSVSKYIGETEKNLSAVLGLASRADTTLYFNDGDDLFGR